MWNRLVSLASWVSGLGVVLMLGGLGLDAYLHALDPELAAHEGIFTLANPGHVLLVGGITLCVAGTLLFLLGQVRARHPQSRLHTLAFGGAAVLVFVLALSSFALGLLADAH